MKHSIQTAAKPLLHIPIVLIAVIIASVLCGCDANITDNPTANTHNNRIQVSDSNLEQNAALVNGEAISENEVTEIIEQMRSRMGAEDEDSWASYLLERDQTPEELRNNTIDSLIDQMLVDQETQARGITVDAALINETIQEVKNSYETEEQWLDALRSMGKTEEEYRKEIERQIKAETLQESMNATSSADQEMLLEYAKLYSIAGDNAKRSSHILFDDSSMEQAQTVLDDIQAGRISFSDAAKRYSIDEATASAGGDLGWDNLNAFSQQYTEALADLEMGDISGLVNTPSGIEIIKCTDVYHAPDQLTRLEEIPNEWLEDIEQIVGLQNQAEAYQTWLQNAKNSAAIEISEMPSGLPYDVDLSKYASESNLS